MVRQRPHDPPARFAVYGVLRDRTASEVEVDLHGEPGIGLRGNDHAGVTERAHDAERLGDKGLRESPALMIAADKESMLIISGTGEVIEPDQDFVAIGSGGNYAYAAANALFNHTDMSAEEIVRESLRIASSICVYTNDNISVEKL